MPLLAGIRQTFSSYVSPQKPSITERLLTPPDSELSQAQDSKTVADHPRTSEVDYTLEGDTLLASASKSRKRPLAATASPSTARKKQKNNDHGYVPEDDSDSDFEGATLETSTPPARTKTKHATTKDATDRALMPPPASLAFQSKIYVPVKSQTPKRQTSKQSEDFTLRNDEEDELSDEETFTSRTAIKRNGPKEVVEFDQQKALRYAEAMTLPETGGDWAEAERDLFYRLAFRGFEPLVPGNWINDFKTLPSSLFSSDGGDPPLIKSHLQREFRAIHALRNLFSMGTIVRDRVLSRGRLRPEPVLKRTLDRYISWALADVGLHPQQRPNAIPVHAIVSMKKCQTTQGTIAAISAKLHRLAERYRNVYAVRDSIEPRDSASVTTGDSGHDDLNLPILTGLMICHSLIIIVTLNSAALYPDDNQNPQRRQSSLQAAKQDSGLRFIATIDFSENDMDVWNALAIAICVMRIRKTMLELCERGEASGENGKGGLWERVIVKESHVESDSDPDV